MKIIDKIKLYLLRRLYLWWTNEQVMSELRGTKTNNEIMDLLYRDCGEGTEKK